MFTKITYRIIADSPLNTKSDESLGIKSEIRREKKQLRDPVIIYSKFISAKTREDCLVDIVRLLYESVDPDTRRHYGVDIWRMLRDRIKSACTTSTIGQFLTRFAKDFNIASYSKELNKRIELFDDNEFLTIIMSEIDKLILRMRVAREDRNDVYETIKEKNKKAEELRGRLNSIEGELYAEEESENLKEEITVLDEEIEALEATARAGSYYFDPAKFVPHPKGVTFEKFFEYVPAVSGNTIRGIIRDLIMTDFLYRLRITKVTDTVYHTLFSGGSLTAKSDGGALDKLAQFIGDDLNVIKEEIKNDNDKLSLGKSGTLELAHIDRMTKICPPLRLLGSAVENSMIQGEMKVSNAKLICKENGFQAPSMWSLITDIFHTRSDASKLERNISIYRTSSAPVQMKYYVEALIEGSEFNHSFSISNSAPPIVKSCFYAALHLFAEYGYLGGMSARGYGEVDLADLKARIPEEEVKKYYDYLKEHKEEMREFFQADFDDKVDKDTGEIDFD